ncbi:PAS domain S-box protein [bacterium]|nr:PAS domain S-box protein [bacterium]MBU1065316.1 PAS domain S-box protein [bacterium]MBU1633760.1 PAS domain S-box protein [bacterium]MBU1873028.1 PAS domain S-box protein [bacterium]
MVDFKKPENLQQLILHISTDFINLSPRKVDAAINHALEIIGKFTGSDRTYVLQLNRSNNTLSNSHEWCADNIVPQIANLQHVRLHDRPWFNEYLLSKEPVLINDVRELPERASTEKAELLAQGIQSLVAVPMIYSNSQIGLVGFDSVRRKRQWTNDEVELLQVIADIFTNALVHRSVVSKLHESEEQYRLLIENLNDGIVISQNDKFIFLNKQFAEMLGYSYHELIMADYRSVYTDEGLEILQERSRRRQRGETVPSRYETIFKKKDGSRLDVEANVRIINYHNAPATFAIVSDITDRKKTEMYQRKLEVEILKRQKVSSRGIFAGGIVHNIRNTLTVIMGRAQLLKQKMPDLKEPDIIISNANKIVQMADNFIKKTKREQLEIATDIDLNDLLKTDIAYMESNQYVKNRADIQFDLDRNIPTIRGHYIDFTHAISGILEFSINAMGKSSRRELHIHTESDEKAIILSISHTGEALSDEDRSSVFTPFYSLKKFAGKRNLGIAQLATMQLFNAYNLLERYRVKFRIETDAEKRTIFYLIIPVSK